MSFQSHSKNETLDLKKKLTSDRAFLDLQCKTLPAEQVELKDAFEVNKKRKFYFAHCLGKF